MVTGPEGELPQNPGAGAFPEAARSPRISAFPPASPFRPASSQPYRSASAGSASPPPRAGKVRHTAFGDTPIFQQTVATRGMPAFNETLTAHAVPAARTGPPPTPEILGAGESTASYGFPGEAPVYETAPMVPVREPTAAGQPGPGERGIFAGPAGRRRVRIRWLAVAAGLVLAGCLVVAAVGLLGGPKVPLLPWPRPAGQPGPGPATGPQGHGSPGGHPAPGPAQARTSRGPARAQPRPSATASQHAAAPAPTASPQPSASASASQHVPPGIARKPTPLPAKPH